MRSLVVGFTLFAALAAEAFADKLADIRAATDARLLQPDGSMRCFPDVKGTAEVYAFDPLGGGDIIFTQIQTERPVRYSDIVVEATDQPVLLALYNYYETVWRVQLKPGARLAGVTMSGYERASIVGLPEGAPVGRNHAFDGKNEAARGCGLKPGELDRVAWKSRRRMLEQEVEGAVAREEQARRAYELAEEAYRRMSDRQSDVAVEAGGRAMLADMVAEIDRLMEAVKWTREELQAFDAAKPAWPPEEATHLTGVGTAMKLWGAEKRLKAYGPWKVVYTPQPVWPSPEAHVVSSVKAREFMAAKVKGRAELDALPGPALPPIRPADGARLLIPNGVDSEKAISMMIAAGYAVKNGPAQKYLNDALHLQKAAIGLPFPDRSVWLNSGMDLTASKLELKPTDVYTLLGPVVTPGCVVSSTLFYLPDGVPDPEGCQSPYNRNFRERDLRLRDYDK